LLCLALALLGQSLSPDDAAPVSAPVFQQEETASQADQPAPDQPATIVIPNGHRIVISVEAQVGSKISNARDMFPIRLAQPVVIDGVEVLPAGIEGEGQVVHAEKGGFAGAAGELILAARYLQFGDRRIELRSFKFIEEGDEVLFRGQDNTDITIATVATIGVLGFLISGGNTTIEPGTIATAKLRNDEEFEVAQPEQVAEPEAVENE
jgi:hypothetical protein